MCGSTATDRDLFATRGWNPAHTVGATLALFLDIRGVCRTRMFLSRTEDPDTPMDASLYFRLTDRIDGAASKEELVAIVAEIERTQPHVVERRALERRVDRRERALVGAA